MVGYYNQGVPTSADLENNSNQNKYTVNRKPKSGVTLSKLTLCLMALAAVLLIALAVGLTILLYPSCSEASPEALTQKPTQGRIVGRLPTNLEPLHYRLQLMPFLEENNFTTSGAVSIRINVKEGTNKISFNSYDIDIDKDSIHVKGIDATSNVDVTDQKFDNVSQIYTITLSENLVKEQQYDIDIKFVSQLNDKLHGFYRSSYKDPKSGTKWMASTQFSPTDARRAFPSFDEPSLKAKFTISIARPKNMTSISNMPKRATDVIVDKANWEWDHYLETPRMSTYLVAFVVSDLQAYRYNSSGKPFTVWTRSKQVDHTRLIIDMTPKLLNYFENYFDIKFPLPKMDLVAVPDFGFNAMENWGLITFRETIMLFDEKTATIEDEREILAVLGHEIAHQWFGNLVTPKWWDDLWLKEGFATYLAYLGTNKVHPEWQPMDEFLMSEVYRAFAVDFLKSSRPISFDVVSSSDIRQSFDSISYAKGASIIRMLNNILGEEVFKKGLIRYLNKHQYSNAHRDDLWESLSQESEEAGLKLDGSIKEIMDTWARQAGFPVITAIRNDSTGEVHVSQKRFLLTTENEDKTLWWVPISYTSDILPHTADDRPKVWLLNKQETSFILEAQQWWLLNLNQTAYYIVNYEENNWRKLIEEIVMFPLQIRVQLISDAMNLARANLLDYDIPLRMLTNLVLRDRQYPFVPHWAALEKVSYLHEMLVSTPIFNKFEEFIFRIYDKPFAKYDFNEIPGESYHDKRMRRLMLKWACKKSGSSCTNNARLLFRKWVERPQQQAFSANVQSIVFCTAIREGGETEWNLAYKQYLSTKSVYEKNTILDALGCSTTPWILSRYLNLLVRNNSEIRKQDGGRVFKAVASNPAGYSVAFNYLRTNWNELNDYYGPAFGIISKMVTQLSTFMNNRYQLSELEDFKNSKANNLETVTQALDGVIEVAKGNIEWMDHSYKSIDSWLDAHTYHYGLYK